MTPYRPVYDRVPAYLWDTLTNASAERREAARLACLEPANHPDERLAQRAVLEALDLIEAEEIEHGLPSVAATAAAVLDRLRTAP